LYRKNRVEITTFCCLRQLFRVDIRIGITDIALCFQAEAIEMSKYQNLTFHLANHEGVEWRASFDEIEEVLRMPLPDSAKQYPAWWANQGRAQSLAWESAGWKTKDVDLKNETIRFIYVRDPDDQMPEPMRLTIAEAKEGLAANFGVSADAVEITIRG
jgi:hypothetical protein